MPKDQAHGGQLPESAESRDRRVEPSAGARIHLVLRFGERMEFRGLALGERLVIGRSSDVDFPIEDVRVSRRHAELANDGGALRVRDFGSRNGTSVGVESFSDDERSAVVGDVIGVGPLEIVVAASPIGQTRRGSEVNVTGAPIIGDPGMQRLFETARTIAEASSFHVLVMGERGVGKGVFAEHVQAFGGGVRGQLDCVAWPESLIDAELFGDETGAFFGEPREGLLASSVGGTLILDGVDELTNETQVKLARALDEQRGSGLPGRSPTRIISTTRKNLEAEVKAGRFRVELYRRLAEAKLEVPPLRERPLEIPVLARSFAERFATLAEIPCPTIDDGAMQRLEDHTWPGNVRELRHAVEHAIIASGAERLVTAHFPEVVRSASPAKSTSPGTPFALRGRGDPERTRIEDMLTASSGDRDRAAALLGMTHTALLEKLESFQTKPR